MHFPRDLVIKFARFGKSAGVKLKEKARRSFSEQSPAEEKKQKEEKKRYLLRKLSFRPTVEELKEKKVIKRGKERRGRGKEKEKKFLRKS